MVESARGNGCRGSLVVASSYFVLAGVAAAAAAGAIVGGIGLLIAVEHRPMVGVVLATALLGLLIARSKPIQFDVETPGRWLRFGNAKTVLLNGSALGIAVTTRLGYWLWFVVPLTALFAGVGFGAALGGLYAATRLGLAVLLSRSVYERPLQLRQAAGTSADAVAAISLGWLAATHATTNLG